MHLMAAAINKRTGAAMVAAALLLFAVSSDASAQSNGVSNFLGNLFSGQKSAAPVQAAPGPDGAPPWSGEDGASGSPLMTASGHP